MGLSFVGSLFKILIFPYFFWFWVGGWLGLGGWVRQIIPPPGAADKHIPGAQCQVVPDATPQLVNAAFQAGGLGLGRSGPGVSDVGRLGASRERRARSRCDAVARTHVRRSTPATRGAPRSRRDAPQH